MNKLISALVAEAIGVFALCFVGIMAIHFSPTLMAGSGLVGVALAHGLILAIMISIFGAASGGHFNPAVTVGLLVGGKIKPAPALAYIAAQVIGGILAGLALLAIFPQSEAGGVVAGGTPVFLEAPGAISVFGACLAELIATFFLVTAVWGTAVDPRAPKIGGFGIGLTVTADILAIGPLTGAAMNPARAFGPALVAAMAGKDIHWNTQWIYWVGPIVGGVLASVIYKGIIWPKNQQTN